MKQVSQNGGNIIYTKIVFLMIMFMILTIIPMAYARENTNNFAFTGMNGINDKSSTMFYYDNNSGNGKVPASFTAEIGHKLSDGIEITAAGSQYPVKLIPITLAQGMGKRNGNRITFAAAPGVHIIYAFKKNGIKEDIVLDHPPATALDIAFRLELDPMLEARLDSRGNVVIYGPNSVLSGFIQTGDAKSAELVLKARQHAPKDNLLYIIPAPEIIDGMGITHNNIAHFSLEKSILTVHVADLRNVPAPVSIDPSIVVTTTAAFMTGNNEGMISYDVDAISRAVPSGGSVANWGATTGFTTTRYSHTSIAYNGYLYVIGGTSGSPLNDVQFAPINANGTIGAWTATTSFTTARYGHTSVAYNGYLYVIGGYSSSNLNDVQFAPINSNGTIGTWTAAAGFTTPRFNHTSVAYNGYLYVIGGRNSVTQFNDIQFTPINANGTIGAWTATTGFTTARYSHASVAYNGHLYVIGGYSGSYLNDVQFAPINSNGTIGTWTATTSFTTARYGHTSVANNGYLYVIGGYNGSYFNDVQFAPINSNGTIGAWTATTGFLTARYGHTSVAYNRYLYVIGGSNGAPLNDIQYAPINTNGVIGTWTATTSFLTARFGHTSVAYNRYLYVIGGYNGALLNDVQFAPINANGTIGAWTATTSFSGGRYAHTSIAYNGYLYVICGYGGSGSDVQFAPIYANGTIGAWTATTNLSTPRYSHTSIAYIGYLYVIGGTYGSPLNDVQFAPINANGTIGAWTATTSFPTARSGHTSITYNGYLYVIGGFGSTSLNDVQFAPINSNGTIGAWTATTSFISPRMNHTSVAYAGFLYILGGYDGGPTYYNDVQFAPINANGTIGAWTATTSFALARVGHTSVAYNGYLYVIGGWNGSSLFNDVQFAPINASGATGTWTATTSFTSARAYHTSVAYNGYLYVIGGYNVSYLTDVQFAPINANGTIGTWTATTSFTTGRANHTSTAYNGYLYVIGGWNGSSFFNDVQFAPINTNGTIGAWTFTTSFTMARRLLTSAAYNGYLYVLGGYNGSSYFNDVQFAPINADGTLNIWTPTSSFTTARGYHTSVAYNGYLYVIGGYNGSYLNDVQFASINVNGMISAWTPTSGFAIARGYHTSVAYNGYLYVVGGIDSSFSYLNDVLFAPVNSNGTIGEWSSTNGFNTARNAHTSVAYNGYLYVIGGYNGSLLNDVQYVTLIGPCARARYSKLIDIGSDKIVESIQFSNSGGKGITNLTYAAAPSSPAVFGSRTMIPGALPSIVYTTNLNVCGRYMWVHFDLDDALIATIDGGGLNGRGNLLDFTVTYNALAGVGTSFQVSKSAPNIHLSWSASPGATSYNVLRCNSAAPPCTPVTIASPATNSYDDPVLSDGINYWYRIQTVSGTCVSP